LPLQSNFSGSHSKAKDFHAVNGIVYFKDCFNNNKFINGMPRYRESQQDPSRNGDQEWSRKLSKRGEDVYGEGEDYGDGYRDPNKPPFPIPYAPEGPGRRQPSGFRYGNQEDEDFGNYGRGGYYGSTYDQEAYNRDRTLQRGGYSPDERKYEAGGMHKGKGPRGYQRSDARIQEDINDRLSEDPFLDASDIEVSVRGSEVTLAGTVESRDAKRRAEDISDSVSGVKNVENRLRVKRNTDWTNRDGNSEDRIMGTKRTNVREAIR
jgi:hypothetical protein